MISWHGVWLLQAVLFWDRANRLKWEWRYWSLDLDENDAPQAILVGVGEFVAFVCIIHYDVDKPLDVLAVKQNGRALTWPLSHVSFVLVLSMRALYIALYNVYLYTQTLASKVGSSSVCCYEWNIVICISLTINTQTEYAICSVVLHWLCCGSIAQSKWWTYFLNEQPCMLRSLQIYLFSPVPGCWQWWIFHQNFVLHVMIFLNENGLRQVGVELWVVAW